MNNVAIIFEFGIPHYRTFLVDYFVRRFKHCRIIHARDKFSTAPRPQTIEALPIIGHGETRLYLLNPIQILRANVIISTFNLRRPHTWMYALFFPWKRWIFWGKGLGSSRHALIRLLRRMLFSVSDGFIVYTDAGLRELVNSGYPGKRVSVAYNTLYIPNHELTEGGQFFLYVGRIQKRKELETIFPYLSTIRKRLWIIGDGSDKLLLEEEINRIGCGEWVTFLPATYDNDELKRLFSCAIAFVSPGPVGLGVVHAFSYGVPVITLRNREHGPEFAYCTESNSYLCDDACTLGTAMEQCLSKPEDHIRKRQEAYRFFTKNLDVQNVFDAFEFHLKQK